MDYRKGQLLQFNIYDKTIVEGTFIKMIGDSIVIKTTKDYLEGNIGREQTIHQSHPHKEIKP